MPDDPTHPDQPDGQQRFRADLLAYLDSLPVHELADLLGELPSSRQEPLQLGVLMVALNERLPDAYKLLPPAGYPGLHEGRRRSLWEVVADRRAARATDRAGPSPPGLAEWHADRQRRVEEHAGRRRVGAVAERRVAEALRDRATDHNPAAGDQHPGDQHPGDPPGEPPDRQREERDSQREDDFGDSWCTYGERADHIRKPTAGRCRSRRRAPRTGCRWAATTKSTTSRPIGRGAGWVRSATTNARTADPWGVRPHR